MEVYVIHNQSTKCEDSIYFRSYVKTTLTITFCLYQNHFAYFLFMQIIEVNAIAIVPNLANNSMYVLLLLLFIFSKVFM